MKPFSKTIHVFTGKSIEGYCDPQIHPENEVIKANELILQVLNGSLKHRRFYSNNPDFVSAIKYIGVKQKVRTIFYLDGKDTGDDIEEIFENFNKSLDLIVKLADIKDI